jgi:hypothetical protein
MFLGLPQCCNNPNNIKQLDNVLNNSLEVDNSVEILDNRLYNQLIVCTIKENHYGC